MTAVLEYSQQWIIAMNGKRGGVGYMYLVAFVLVCMSMYLSSCCAAEVARVVIRVIVYQARLSPAKLALPE